jgi:hypothetical protein
MSIEQTAVRKLDLAVFGNESGPAGNGSPPI